MEEQASLSGGSPHDQWQYHQGRGEIAKALGEMADAATQFTLASLVLVKETSDDLKLLRAHSLVSLGIVYLIMEQPDMALDAFLEARELRRGLIPEQHFLSGELHHQMANARRFLGQFELAHEHFNDAWWCFVNVLPKTHPYVITVAQNWMHANVAWDAVKRNNGGL
jgi:tetratricopeptide (TPR) repeat protein